MNRIEQWIASFNDTSIRLQERMFRLLVTIGLATLCAVSVVAIILGEQTLALFTMVSGFFALALTAWLGFRFKKTDIAMRIIVFVMIMFVIPVGFFGGGGLNGGSPVWFVFSFVLISLLLEGTERNAFIALSAVVISVCYIIAYYRPELVTEHDTEMAFMDSYASVMLLSALICAMIIISATTKPAIVVKSACSSLPLRTSS